MIIGKIYSENNEQRKIRSDEHSGNQWICDHCIEQAN